MAFSNESVPCEAKQVSKPERMLGAIRNISSIVERIETMKDRLGIACDPVGKDVNEPDKPTVVSIMTNGAEAIDQLVSQIHNSLDAIDRDLL